MAKYGSGKGKGEGKMDKMMDKKMGGKGGGMPMKHGKNCKGGSCKGCS